MKTAYRNIPLPLYTVLVLWLAMLYAPAQATVIAKLDASQPLPPQIAAAPSRVTVDLQKGRANGSIRVFNLGNKPMAINASVKNWQMDRSNNVQVIAPTAQSLASSIIINPVSFTIAPGKTQVVRYSVRPRQALPTGEHRAMIFFDQAGNKPAQGTMNLKFRLGVALYGVNGNITREGVLHDVSLQRHGGQLSVLTDIQSVGNANVRLDGQVTVWPRSRFPGAGQVSLYSLKSESPERPRELVSAAALNALPVLPGTRRIVQTSLIPPSNSGNYVVHLQGTISGSPFSKTLSLNIQ